MISIEDSLGEVEDYEKNGNEVSITTNSGDRRTSETVRISLRIDREAEEIYQGLYQRSFSLAGFSGEKTTGSLRNDNLLSGWTSHGFDTAYSDEYLNFTGEGSVSIRTKFGEGQETKYYEFFGGKPPENTELAYEVSVGTTGNLQGFERFPVASMGSRTFNETVAKWSSGEYTGGSIKIRENLEKNDFLAVLAHETVHGLNDREFNWDRTRSSYIEEGTGKYVEFLMRMKFYNDGVTDRPPSELFGKEKRYDPDESDDVYYTIPSSGEKERLWEYYQQDQEFMKTWNPMDSSGTRDFGYAYSQLIIRNYIARMDGSMSDIYREVRPGQKIESAEEKWMLYGQIMDMEPCKYESRERFEECLETINKYDYEVLRATEIDRESSSIRFTQIEVPNRTQENEGGLIPDFGKEGGVSNESNRTSTSRYRDFKVSFRWLQRLFENILQSFN
jgi:hypothetical protein